VTHLRRGVGGVGEHGIPIDRREQEDSGVQLWCQFSEQFEGGVIAFPGVGPAEVEILLVDSGFLHELSPLSKVLQVVELGLHKAVHCLHVGVGVGAAGWSEAMAGGKGCFHGGGEAPVAPTAGVAVVLGTVVGLDSDGGQVQAVLLEVAQQSADGELGVGG